MFYLTYDRMLSDGLLVVRCVEIQNASVNIQLIYIYIYIYIYIMIYIFMLVHMGRVTYR